MREYVIVGGGIGGCSAAALLHHYGHDVVLIEKEPYLGGCASTFTHLGRRYNTGATTLSGYDEDGVVKKLFDTLNITPPIIESDPAIVIIQKGKKIHRYRDISKFLDELTLVHPHSKHDQFWNLIAQINDWFYKTHGYYYSNASKYKKTVSLMSFIPMAVKFFPYIRHNAQKFIEQFYGGITPEYHDFLNAQIRIVAQDTIENVNFFTAALALGYTFNPTHYALGGMGKICDALVSNVYDVRTSTKVQKIEKMENYYTILTNKGVINSRNIIMGTSHYESSRWFDDDAIHRYYRKYEKLNNHQSAFVLYMSFHSTDVFEHHYQFINSKPIAHTISNSLFVSISDATDSQMCAPDEYSLTASIHVDLRDWIQADPSLYAKNKQKLHSLIQNWICDTLHISPTQIIDSFCATPKTFEHYLHRTQLGGNAMNLNNLLPRLPSNNTPIVGFYHVGDTSYAAQGWPGVVMGAFNLCRLIHG